MKYARTVAGLFLVVTLLFCASCGMKTADDPLQRTEHADGRLAYQAAADSATGGNNMNLRMTAAADSAISLTWDAVPGAEGYNLYNGSTKINSSPIKENFYCVIGLPQNTFFAFTIAAVTSSTSGAAGVEGTRSDIYYAATRSMRHTGPKLPSGDGKQVSMPYSDMAINMEYLSPAMSDPDYYYWCISPIEDDEGKTHLFVARWPRTSNGMWDWKVTCEIAHCVGDSPEGPFEYVDTAISNKDVPKPQFAPHNVRVKKIDGLYCLVYITQGGPLQKDQKICLATSESPYGPWTLQGEKGDGVVVQPSATGWTAGALLGTDNPDIIKIGNEYFIYFKAGLDFSTIRYGYAVSSELTKGYVNSEDAITDNRTYIEDATVFEMDGKIYLLTTDNFGGNTGVQGYGILWESTDGRSFKLADAKVGFGVLSDYTAIPPYATAPYEGQNKVERPAVLMRNGKPAYFYASSGLNILGLSTTNTLVFKINSDPPDTNPKQATIKFAAGGGSGNMPDGMALYGTNYKIPVNTFTRSGMTFDGWTASGAVVGNFTDSDTVKYIIGEVTLTARWK
ncbi:MAG: InlB B-repeat-containing protein [Oscillospiraceae bacterium]|nr:InlB B-repeat-containing protein [Oscillospiraceae bacterium]